jgi:Tn3 transposase DDE domain
VITNQCGRLTSSVIIAYNPILLSTLLERYRAAGDHKAIMLLRTISPMAWQYAHFHGRCLFRGNRQPIDLVALLGDVAL